MRIRIDTDLCTGHGRCFVLSPEIFDSDDSGYGQVVTEEITPDLLEAARRAVTNCPEQAITLDEQGS